MEEFLHDAADVAAIVGTLVLLIVSREQVGPLVLKVLRYPVIAVQHRLVKLAILTLGVGAFLGIMDGYLTWCVFLLHQRLDLFYRTWILALLAVPTVLLNKAVFIAWREAIHDILHTVALVGPSVPLQHSIAGKAAVPGQKATPDKTEDAKPSAPAASALPVLPEERVDRQMVRGPTEEAVKQNAKIMEGRGWTRSGPIARTDKGDWGIPMEHRYSVYNTVGKLPRDRTYDA